MKATLREHPLVTEQGIRSWPPNWLWTSGKKSAIAAGEVGILQDVKTHDVLSSKCFLFIEHSGATFIDRISCDSAHVCQALVNLLKHHIGEPLRSIRELPIDLAEIPLSFHVLLSSR
jgi:hypothetical protein